MASFYNAVFELGNSQAKRDEQTKAEIDRLFERDFQEHYEAFVEKAALMSYDDTVDEIVLVHLLYSNDLKQKLEKAKIERDYFERRERSEGERRHKMILELREEKKRLHAKLRTPVGWIQLFFSAWGSLLPRKK